MQRGARRNELMPFLLDLGLLYFVSSNSIFSSSHLKKSSFESSLSFEINFKKVLKRCMASTLSLFLLTPRDVTATHTASLPSFRANLEPR